MLSHQKFSYGQYVGSFFILLDIEVSLLDPYSIPKFYY